MATRARYRQAPGAEQTIRNLCGDQVLDLAETIAERIPDAVPVQSGTSRRSFRRGLRADREPKGAARVVGFPPNWHWFEFGTRWNPPYAPIRRTIERLGMRYVKA